MEKNMNPDDCIHCGKCKKNCLFLQKYDIAIGDKEKLYELAYHCFLCGECSKVCPIGIDGKEIILEMRRRKVRENNGKVPENGYSLLQFEKKDYIYKNYKNSTNNTVLFPGCNFPSLFPKTTKKLMEIFKKHGIGTVFDCCGKPISELGLTKEEGEIVNRLEKNLKKHNIEEIIILCPNCYAFLKPVLNIKITSIYEKLQELGIGEKIEAGKVYPTCQERGNFPMFGKIEPFLDGEASFVEGIQCCGLGGCASSKEPEISSTMAGKTKDLGKVLTFCASCTGIFDRNGGDAEHILLKILGEEENPDSKKSMINRISTRWWKV